MGNRDYLQQLVGNRLSAVTFILDYLQLQFDHPTLTILTPIRVLPELGAALVAEGEEAFRNRLCEQIAKVGASVAYRPNDAMEITFQDGGMLSVSLLPEDYSGPEAMHLHGFSVEGTSINQFWDVIRPDIA